MPKVKIDKRYAVISFNYVVVGSSNRNRLLMLSSFLQNQTRTRKIDLYFGFMPIRTLTAYSILLRFIFFHSLEVFFCCVNCQIVFFPSSLLRQVCGCVISIKMIGNSKFQLHLCSMNILIHALNKLKTHSK